MALLQGRDSPDRKSLEALLKGSKASILWIHPARSTALTAADAASLEPSPSPAG